MFAFKKWVTGHCNRAAVSRNRYGIEKNVDTHKILINAIKCYVCLQEIWSTKPCVRFYDEISPISMYIYELKLRLYREIDRYGVEKTVDTHKILINAIKFYVWLQEIW